MGLLHMSNMHRNLCFRILWFFGRGVFLSLGSVDWIYFRFGKVVGSEGR